MASQPIHRQEQEQFIKLFEKDRIDRFADRLAILEVFLKIEKHVTLSELGAQVRLTGHRFSDDFVQETIELMCRYGFAQANQFDNGVVRYEHRHLGQHHDHLICTKCQKILEFENRDLEQLQVQIAAAYGFHILQHKMELYGICRDCLDQREQVLTLDAARPGERLKIVEFTGGVQSRLRLLTMGVRIGDEVEVITNIQRGQVVLAVDFKRLVLGQGLAEKIRVVPTAAAPGPKQQH
jgi:Fur family transcriptional regulator, ferric uptake regulator